MAENTVKQRSRSNVPNPGETIVPALFECIDPEAGTYPLPAIPLLPYLTPPQIRLGGRDLPHFLSKSHRFFRNARSALAFVIKALDFKSGRILVPGYICKSVIEPIVWSGFKPVFYELHEDLAVDETDFISKLADADAAIVTHFFGMPQRIDVLAEVCRENSVVLIEDCAHAFMGHYEGKPLGAFGDFAIASSIKFCPGIEGGLLICNGTETAGWDTTPAASISARSLFELLQQSYQGYVSKWKTPTYLVNTVPPEPSWRASRMGLYEPSPSESGRYEWFDPEHLDMSGDYLSYKLLFNLDYRYIRERRRENFMHFVQGLAELNGCRPLINELREETIPYMCPLFVENIEKLFRVFKHRRVPNWRWEQQHKNIPARGRRLGHGLLHLPVHQCIETTDIDHMVSAIRGITAE